MNAEKFNDENRNRTGLFGGLHRAKITGIGKKFGFCLEHF
jgi:hypothetical protein